MCQVTRQDVARLSLPVRLYPRKAHATNAVHALFKQTSSFSSSPSCLNELDEPVERGVNLELKPLTHALNREREVAGRRTFRDAVRTKEKKNKGGEL